MRLAKYIAQRGYCSRRKAEELIRSGRVEVNGVPAEITTPVDPEKDAVTVEGVKISGEQPVYIMLHKPPGVLSTCKAGKEKGLTLLDLVKIPQRIYPVGRLDKDSSGLLLLTNDGELAFSLTHPSQEVEKEYYIELDQPFSRSDIEKLTEGVNIEGTDCLFHRLERAGDKSYRVTLKQGKKRQIRLMARHTGKRVTKLVRIREGALTLGNLPEGKWRCLTVEEIDKLKST